MPGLSNSLSAIGLVEGAGRSAMGNRARLLVRASTVPARAEEIEVHLFHRVCPHKVLVQRDAQSGTCWQGKAAVGRIDLGQTGRGRLDPTVGEVVEVFLDLE